MAAVAHSEAPRTTSKRPAGKLPHTHEEQRSGHHHRNTRGAKPESQNEPEEQIKEKEKTRNFATILFGTPTQAVTLATRA